MTLAKIRQDLRNGVSIAEVCTNYNITFQNLCNKCKGYNRKQTLKENLNSKKEDKYIVRNSKNRYTVKKSVNSKSRIFGTYYTLEDALRMRDALIADGWHQTHVDSICEELGIKRRSGYINEKVRYH